MSSYACRINRSKVGRWLAPMLPALVFFALCLPGSVLVAAEGEPEQNATLQLAGKIAQASGGDDRATRLALLTSYESVYGGIDKVPTRWPALVRRALVCQQLSNRVCMRSSVDALRKLGGPDALQLTHLFEVSRYGMSAVSIKNRLNDAEDLVSGPDAAPRPTPVEKATPAPQAAKPKNIPADAAPPAPPVTVNLPATATPAEKPVPVAATEVTVKPVSEQPVRAPAKAAAPRTLTQRAAARLNKLGFEDQAGFFLDALFAAVAICLILLFLLFSSARARRVERRLRLQALQEIQRQEELRGEEKIKTDHELWSEQLKSEVALEAQKAHAENVLRTVQSTADEAMKAERQRFQMEYDQAAQAFNAEKRRLSEALKAEQLKTEEMVKAAKARADQAIDAYDQMAARELVYAHKQNDELQEALKAEQQLREALESKVGDAMQQVEAYKQRESRWQEAVNVEQRGRASEARLAAEKLKAAQQAAAALQASLAATRALNADLERRADEAMKAAQVRIAEAAGAKAMPDADQGQGAGQRNQNY